MRRLAALLVVVSACGAPEETASAAPPRPAPESTPAPAQPGAAAAETEPSPAPLTPEASDRARALQGVFANGVCDPAAVEALRGLVRTHGDAPALVEAQTVAFNVCEDSEALAELTARTLPADATTMQRLQLGAAWLRAARYEEAAAVLEPVAQAEGPSSKAAWLAGFALFHAGRSAQARTLLESARAHAPANRSDAWLLVGLCKLHDGDPQGATEEFEAGVAIVPDDPSLWSALARAYAVQNRDDDARAARERAREAHDARAKIERAQSRLAARAKALQTAAAAGDVEVVERSFEQLWPEAPTALQVQLLRLRADVYTRAGRADDANADRTKASTLAATLTSGDTP